ncbi:DUF5107 domain-containing protein [Bacteroidota bacterium]
MNSYKQYSSTIGSSSGFAIFIFLLLPFNYAFSQSASITEEIIKLKTYPYSDPDPVPILISNTKIFPYHKFEGYSHEARDMSWKVVRLENDYIQVFVLPEVGGKVWGAIEKSTGEEFIYRNEVMKFRNIAMRGPWTSGGIELNFGIIGHNPSTASPVDYMTRENEDGSVSCIVGNLDLPSRTYWTVEIRLAKDKAYFETRVSWQNPTPLNQSYYNWMTASAAATNDLEFFYPGNLYLAHSGEARLWPIDLEGRALSLYKNNAFGPSKSYHVVGELNDFFGGYFHNKNFGFGHWAPYEEMPGQKLWLWALSRSGGIWEDLLTDTDGQYIEFQAGRLLNQYSPGNHRNPIRQVGFEPYTSDQWKEIWFPFKGISGMVDVSPSAVLNVEEGQGKITIGINALETINDPLMVYSDCKIVFEGRVNIKPMGVFKKELSVDLSKDYQILLGDQKLNYSSNPDLLTIDRPFESDNDMVVSRTQELLNTGIDELNFREYELALNTFQHLLTIDPSHVDALLGLSELYIRKGEYDEALNNLYRVLRQNTYHADANYLAGITYRAKGEFVDALESLGWAARSMKYRSSAYVQMAEIFLRNRDYKQGKYYANKALDFNKYNISAYQVLAIISRNEENESEFLNVLNSLREIHPLSHFARFEKFLNSGTDAAKKEFLSGITNEFPEEIHLELAITYHKLGLTDEAIQVLSTGPECVKNQLWLAYLYQTINPLKSRSYMDQCLESSPEFVFPYRIETLKMLEWATNLKDSWKLNYYLALNYQAIGRDIEAAEILTSCGGDPDYWVFYLVRAEIEMDPEHRLADIKEAFDLAPEVWRTSNRIVRHFVNNQEYDHALEYAEKAFTKFPDNNTIGFIYAKSLLYNGKYEKCIEILNNMNILPFEGSFESRLVFEDAHIHRALELIEKKDFNRSINVLMNALEWPENIGVGKPYDPDERRQHYLLAYCYQQQNNESESTAFLKKVTSYTQTTLQKHSPNHILGLLAMRKLGLTGEAGKMMKSVQEKDPKDTDLNEWLTAVDKNDMNELSVLSDLYSSDNQYTTIFRILKLTD